MRRAVLTLVPVLALLPSVALAQQGPTYAPPPPGTTRAPGYLPGFHEHDGFFLRLRLGAGDGYVHDPDVGLNVSGALLGFDIQIGGAISKNFILYGAVPETEFSVKNTASGEQGTIIPGGLCAGATYYFMPANIYADAMLGIGLDQFQFPSGNFNSGRGTAVGLGVGKEWWVSPNWGIGVAGRWLYVDVSEGDTIGLASIFNGGSGNGRITSSSFVLDLSTTYN